jgi:hypothetical protein
LTRTLSGAGIAAGAILSLAAIAVIAGGAKSKPLRTSSSEMAKGRVPVVVELFTSEGCSSCPSADQVLADLQKSQPVANALIIPLSEHVDYWNYIGWADPFSNASFSERQRNYARALRLESIYTPQMIVNGRTEFVGSDRSRAESAIEQATGVAHASVEVKPVSTSEATTSVQVHIDNIPASGRGDSPEVMLAITEDNLQSNVRRGENSGRRLAHTAVVRQLRSIGTAIPGRTFSANTAVTIDRGWKRGDLNAVVFVQEKSSRKVIGAGIAPLGVQ